jgi:hypothetical protein
MKRLIIILSVALMGSVTACGDDQQIVDEMPALNATQIDRIGRPAIATALQETFNGAQDARYAAKDAYNMNASPANWAAYAGGPPANPGEYAQGFYGSLAILDSLDAQCGNQIAYDPEAKYAPLAGVLADDRLWVNSSYGDCSVSYLAVEANALGIIPNQDCGGRTLSVDIADRSYSVLAAGALAGVTDGVDANDVEYLAEFPYLAAPN